MTPNTRKRKSRIANDLAEFIEQLNLSDEDQVDVITLSLKKLNLLDVLQFQRKPTKAGRKVTPMTVRKSVWEFWHGNSTASTITSRPAKIRVTDKRKIQAGLNFVDTATIIQQRNRNFYESHWYIVNVTYKELYQKYIKDHPNELVSIGTFFALKPFYIRTATTKDIEMCCCKKHLHARWSIQALIECAAKQSIDISPIGNYTTFFEYLTADCSSESTTYLSWECTADSSHFCKDIEKKME